MAGSSRGTSSRGGAKGKSAAKVVKPSKKIIHSTASSRRHHFEGFTQRIAKLKIDPIRRTRRAIGAEGSHELHVDSSYFRTALDEWKDINLSENFTAFAKAVYPLSESLAMVLHYEDRIMDILLSHIEQGNIISLEPLLALMSHFAHDLDVRFEKHFQRAVATITQIAARDPEPEVVEWCFSCLAWLFKYLSRLLVPDLRPLYDLMAPYLGKQRQKPFIIRFAAEAMSFLVRKAGSAYTKNKAPLVSVVNHMLRDYAASVASAPNDLYSQGLMTLFTESIKGVQGSLHSGGNAVLQCLTSFCFDPEHDVALRRATLEVLKGSLISVLHHTDVETFKPILDAILDMTDLEGADALNNLDAASMLLFTVSSHRKGSRIGDWSLIIGRVAGLAKAIDKSTAVPDHESMTSVLKALAVVLHYAPIDAVLAHITIFDTISRGKWRTTFLPFCTFFADLDPDRFQGLLLSHFQRFVASNWKESEASLCALIPALSESGTFSKTPLQCPSAWQKGMLAHLTKALAKSPTDREGDDLLAICNGELSVLRVTQGDAATRKSISAQLLKMVKEAAQSESSELGGWDLFALGQAFQFVSDVAPDVLQEQVSLKTLCSASSRTKGLLAYWQALNKVIHTTKDLDLSLTWMQEFLSRVIDCLSSPSHDLRLVAMNILENLYHQSQQEVPDLISVALSIEETPPSVQTARFISSQIRRLAMGFSAVSSDDILVKAIPAYCFGLLHLQLSQAWQDSIDALKEMAQNDRAEQRIFDVTFNWLQGSAQDEEATDEGEAELSRQIAHVSSDFQCSNILQIERACEIALAPFTDPQTSLQHMFARQHRRAPPAKLSNRSQALLALNGMPQLAEKRSRILVPVLLEWAGDEMDAEDMDESTDGERWNRKDQKAMLNVFAQFQNPRVLFKAEEVRHALLNLLSNGDAEIQKSALKALVSWKTPGVVKYQEHLFNFLDDARFREEVSVFLRLDQEGDAIRSEDCAELMPVLLRLLYGRAVTRAGSASGKRGQQTRRKAIFVALARFPDAVLQQFLEISLGALSGSELIVDGGLNSTALDEFSFAQRKQVGLLNMLDDMLQTLGDRLNSFATKIADAVLLCLLKISKVNIPMEDSDNDVAEDQHTSLDRAIRQAGFHCLIQLFSSCIDVAWHGHAAIIMKELVKPRLDKLPVETAQSVSGTLRLFSTWSSQLSTCTFLTEFYPETLHIVAECLTVPSAKNEVKLFIVENIIGRLLDTIEPRQKSSSSSVVKRTAVQEVARKEVLEPNAGAFVVRLGGVLRQSPPKDLLDSSVLCVSRLAPLVSGVENIRDVIDVSIYLLGQPPRTVHHTTKRDLLQTLSFLIPSAELKPDEESFDKIYTTLCPLFAFFKDRESRTLLSAVTNQLSTSDEQLTEVARLCDDLNSWLTNRLDEPDYERRSEAFNAINEDKYKVFTARQWQPLVYNMLYYIRDNEELAIRTNASYSLRRFIEAASQENDFKNDGFRALVSEGLWPGLQTGIREPSELVRVEFLYVTAHLIKYFPTWPAVSDMHSLLVDNDEEASFFHNILHIQQHRRLRALRRLADEAKDGVISSTNVSNFFIPILEHFVFDPASDEGSYMLAAETIQSVGALTGCLDWQQYRNTLRRFVGYIKSKEELQKTVLRLVSAVIDALDNAAQAKNEASVDKVDGMDVDVDESPAQGNLKLTATLPSPEKLSSEINKQFLPPLTDYLHLKDESTVSLRVPVAISVIKLIRVLPAEEHPVKLPSVLMDLCHILRSKATEARDMTRKTLSKIMDILGASYFGYILKELRSALQRGYQLHVLSFTVHSLLVENIDALSAGALDYCLPDLVAIVMDDIFGVVGQEKDAEEYISQMKEVKSSKSYDSMELCAKITTLPHLGQLIRPIQTLLLEKIDLKTVKKIDELLRRIGLGTTQNAAVKDRDVLKFCYEVVQHVYATNAADKMARPVLDYKIRKYLIQMKSANKNSHKGATTSYTFKLVKFALELVRSVLQRHEDLKTPANLAGFLPIIGDSLVGGQEEVMMAAVRLMTAIIKVPSPKIAENAPVYASEAVKMIRASPSTTTELAQAALKLVSAILRERPNIKIKENDMAYMLKRLKPDLEEPDRQGVIFNFLRAVVGRKIVIAEVYETMDTVAAIMVTNQTRTARDLARGIYFQFMMDYPQASNRLQKQMGFLIKNLEFKYPEGRQSILELLHQLLSKTNGDLLQELASMLFVPLVMMMVNDDNPQCREMAGALITKIFARADAEHLKNFVSLIRTWLEQNEQALLRRIALQCWTMYISGENEVAVPAKDVSFLFKQLAAVLVPDGKYDVENWEILYYSLQAFAKLCETAPTTALAPSSKAIWNNIFNCMTFPHAWVKLSSSRLVGLLFADVGSASSKTEKGLAALPLKASGGMELTEEEMRRLCNSSLRIMRSTSATEQLVQQTARNLVFLGRCYGVNDAMWVDDRQVQQSPEKETTNGDVDEEGEDDDEEEDAEVDVEDDASEAETATKAPLQRSALNYLLNRLSSLVRRESPGGLSIPALQAKTACLQSEAALTNLLPPTVFLTPTTPPTFSPSSSPSSPPSTS